MQLNTYSLAFQDLHWIFGRYINWDNAGEKNMWVWYMQEYDKQKTILTKGAGGGGLSVIPFSVLFIPDWFEYDVLIQCGADGDFDFYCLCIDNICIAANPPEVFVIIRKSKLEYEFPNN